MEELTKQKQQLESDFVVKRRDDAFQLNKKLEAMQVEPRLK